MEGGRWLNRGLIFVGFPYGWKPDDLTQIADWED
jgi:hypothetical protein